MILRIGCPLGMENLKGFFHYITEIKWHLAGMKSSERPLAAARLLRKILESDYPALKSLAYKLDPADFDSEDAVNKLISFLELSPMNRQPIPDAGRHLSAYYRRLARKHHETIPQFLIREETLHDAMWCSLQRLLREKELDFDQYDCSLEELRAFCGMPADKSYYIPEQVNHESFDIGSQRSGSGSTHPSRAGQAGPPGEAEAEVAEAASTPSMSRAHSHTSHGPIGSSPPKPLKRLDLIERLMQKGLIPLAALDIIRGWLVLDCASATELDKSLVKASTQNKLGYQSIRSALLALNEDRGEKGQSHPSKGFGRGKGHAFHVVDDYDGEEANFHDQWHDEGDPYHYDSEYHGEDGSFGEDQGE